jgi:hypothetical protein
MSHSQALKRMSRDYVIDLYLRPPVRCRCNSAASKRPGADMLMRLLSLLEAQAQSLKLQSCG